MVIGAMFVRKRGSGGRGVATLRQFGRTDHRYRAMIGRNEPREHR